MDVRVFYTFDNREFAAEVISHKDGNKAPDDIKDYESGTYELTHILVPMMTGQIDANGNPSVSLVPYSLLEAGVTLIFDEDEFRNVQPAAKHLVDRYQTMFGKVQLASVTDIKNLTK